MQYLVQYILKNTGSQSLPEPSLVTSKALILGEDDEQIKKKENCC